MEKTFEGYVRFADGSIVSLQCFEGRASECPGTFPDGYVCEGPCPEVSGAGEF
jgi:hypothetical protein